jgi:hypothetical protein
VVPAGAGAGGCASGRPRSASTSRTASTSAPAPSSSSGAALTLTHSTPSQPIAPTATGARRAGGSTGYTRVMTPLASRYVPDGPGMFDTITWKNRNP